MQMADLKTHCHFIYRSVQIICGFIRRGNWRLTHYPPDIDNCCLVPSKLDRKHGGSYGRRPYPASLSWCDMSSDIMIPATSFLEDFLAQRNSCFIPNIFGRIPRNMYREVYTSSLIYP
jgi:hypothetical protein